MGLPLIFQRQFKREVEFEHISRSRALFLQGIWKPAHWSPLMVYGHVWYQNHSTDLSCNLQLTNCMVTLTDVSKIMLQWTLSSGHNKNSFRWFRHTKHRFFNPEVLHTGLHVKPLWSFVRSWFCIFWYQSFDSITIGFKVMSVTESPFCVTESLNFWRWFRHAGIYTCRRWPERSS